ncbi:MAG: HlyD family efflux transporter periplasmic adaptor subunit [Flavobacteriaceae bacterium]|nr:HlyD family efflux transporter periplasmic adaptor subunit [Flavobacteriaceae bacterium]
MHCEGEKTYEQPGSCPVCKMDLVMVKVKNNDQSGSFDHLVKPTDSFVAGDFQSTAVKDTVLFYDLTLPGIVTFDPDASVNISARVSGRIEKFYVNYKYQKVSKGQKLFDVYSPELLTEQQNFIYLISNDPENTPMVNAAKQKLMLYGMTGSQIKVLMETKRTRPHISIFSPASGIITGTEGMNQDPTSMQNVSQVTEQLTVKQGDYINKGVTVFKLLDNNKVWAVFHVTQENQPYVRKDQPIRISSELDKNGFIDARINFVETQLDPANKTNRIRVSLNNDKLNFPVGLRLTGMVQSIPLSGLWIPQQAFLDLGHKKIVFLKEEMGFKTREISTGAKVNGFVQVVGGITASDRIAENAQYLVDSESFIKTTQNEK